jgi:hypothetical protein
MLVVKVIFAVNPDRAASIWFGTGFGKRFGL